MSQPDRPLIHLNDVRERSDWWLGLIVRGEKKWEVPLHRHGDKATFYFTMSPPYSMAEVHEEARRQIEAWEREHD